MEFHCITLHEYPERRERLKRLLDNNFNYKVHTFNKNKNPVEGCYSSHIKLYKYMIKKNLKYIAILEDNVVYSPTFSGINSGKDFKEYWQEKSKDLYKFIESEKFDTMHLAGFFYPFDRCSKVKNYKKIYKVTAGMLGTSCYIISREACEKMIKEYEKFEKDAIDIMLAKRFNRRYIHSPLLFHHAHPNELSSTINPKADKLRNIFFKPSMYKTTEILFFSLSGNGLMIFSIVIILILLFLIIFIIVIIVRFFLRRKTS